jgi:FlgD Ig-like domain
MIPSMGSALRLWQHVLGVVRGPGLSMPCRQIVRPLLSALLPVISLSLHAGTPQTFAVALPEQEGPVTLAVFSASGEPVRLLHYNAPVDTLQAGLNGLLITWDGRDDSGKDLPSGEYDVRGLVHGPVRTDILPESLSPTYPADPPSESFLSLPAAGFPLPSDSIVLKAPKDELQESRPLVSFRARIDQGRCLVEADGMPLVSFVIPPGASLISLTHGESPGSAIVSLREGGVTMRWRVEGLDRVVPIHPGTLRLGIGSTVAGETIP